MPEVGDVDDIVSRPAATTLYQAIEAKGKFMGRTNILYSVVMVGKISPHISNVKEVSKKTSFRTIMRILRLLNDSENMIHCYIDRYTEILNKDLGEDEERKTFSNFDLTTMEQLAATPSLAPLTSNRILSIKDNIFHRIYRTYEVLTLDMEPVSLAQYDSSESDEKRLMETLSQLLRLSIFLSEEPMKNQEEYVPEIFKLKLTALLRTLREEHPELVPPQVCPTAQIGYGEVVDLGPEHRYVWWPPNGYATDRKTFLYYVTMTGIHFKAISWQRSTLE